MKGGDTFLVSLVADEHLWIVLSDPEVDPQRVVMVNFSTWKPYHDQACILDRGDHPFVRHRTCVNFPEARLSSNETLERLRIAKQIFLQQPVSSELLGRLRDSARRSRMRLDYVQILVDQGLIE